MSHWRFFAALWLAGSLIAQVERASIVGTITDKTGSIITGAVVKITHESTNTSISVTTGEAGNYSAPNLAPGSAIRVGWRPEDCRALDAF